MESYLKDRSSPVTRIMDAINDSSIGPRLADALDHLAEPLQDKPEIVALLEGTELTGTPLHPGVVHFPIGMTFGAALIDLLGAQRQTSATQLLHGFALLSTFPAVATGHALYMGESDEQPRVRRLGAVHAAVAAVSTGTSALSFLARAVGLRKTARVLLLGACAGYVAAGMIGGELVYGEGEYEESEAWEAIFNAAEE